MSHNSHKDGDRRSSPRLPDDGLSPTTMHSLLTSVTAIKAQSQLLQRRLRRTGTFEVQQAAKMLIDIDRAATDLAKRLNGLRRDEPEDA